MTRVPVSPDVPGPSTLPPSPTHSRMQTPGDLPQESTRARLALDGARTTSTPSETAMTAVTAEPDPHIKALVEDFRKEFRLLGEAHAGHTEHLYRTVARLEQEIQELQHQIIAVDVKLTAAIHALDHRVDALDHKVDALDHKVDALDHKFDTFSTELSRIATHLGLQGAPPPAQRRQ
jgi:predicted RNase H-like nuclease (RuvC/YqgF family)